jgi:hypothetical protein
MRSEVSSMRLKTQIFFTAQKEAVKRVKSKSGNSAGAGIAHLPTPQVRVGERT